MRSTCTCESSEVGVDRLKGDSGESFVIRIDCWLTGAIGACPVVHPEIPKRQTWIKPPRALEQAGPKGVGKAGLPEFPCHDACAGSGTEFDVVHVEIGKESAVFGQPAGRPDNQSEFVADIVQSMHADNQVKRSIGSPFGERRL